MTELMTLLFVFAVSFVVGYILISRIPPLLHTPLMSMTNAISAVTILGAVLILSVELGFYQKVLGVTAIIMATFNVVGGFVITDRMLKLFKKKVPTE